MITLLKKGGRYNAQIEEYEVESDNEIASILDAPVGSTVFVVGTGETKKLMSDGTWKKLSTGGGSGDAGGGLPDVTAADNGKVLGVVDGAWAATDAPSGGGGDGGSLPPVTAADDGKVLGVVDGAWAATDAPSGGGDVLRIPFTLTMDPDTGAITGTTDVPLADAIAAKAAGKVLIADASFAYSETMTQYFCAVMNGHTGDGAALSGVSKGLSRDGDYLDLYVIAWTGDGDGGVQVIGKRVAVTDP